MKFTLKLPVSLGCCHRSQEVKTDKLISYGGGPEMKQEIEKVSVLSGERG